MTAIKEPVLSVLATLKANDAKGAARNANVKTQITDPKGITQHC